MKVAILGGSFDPPHIGHILIAEQVIERIGVDQVWLMPNQTTSTHHKIFQKEMSPTKVRLAMAKLLETDKIKVSNFEIIENPSSITITTLEMMTQKYPEHEFYWITGSDKLETFHMYDRWEDILKNYKLVVFPREHVLWHLEEKVKAGLRLQTIPENVIVLNDRKLILTNVSSSTVRERQKKNLSIKYLVPKQVEEYIKEYQLYK
ncbi:nicotinate (nicotinamide) nucleotide adenylyltransferase [Candidatus Roizmanbacteria bacterium]|nr:nicotinate (nicotinamide) nucleotide adenylyltransferase [Candidatus Roizmanbacteria bacterium]